MSPSGLWGVKRGQLSLKWGLWLAPCTFIGWVHALRSPRCRSTRLCVAAKMTGSRPELTPLCTLQALQPKLEAMEASWYRLHSISGADTPEEVISYWEGESSQSRAHSRSAMRAAANACLRGG